MIVLISCVNLIALENEFSFKDMKKQKEFLNTREKMIFSTIYTITINLMISIIYSTGEKRIYELVSDASKRCLMTLKHIDNS